MRLMRDRITVEEAKELTDPRARERLLNHWEQPAVNDPFVVIGQDEILYYSGDCDDYQDGYRISYGDGKESAFHDDCVPLLSVAQMIDIVSFEQHLQIQSYGTGWIIIADNLQLQVEVETRDLCGMLWKMMKTYLSC